METNTSSHYEDAYVWKAEQDGYYFCKLGLEDAHISKVEQDGYNFCKLEEFGPTHC